MADLNDTQKQFLASMMKNIITKPEVNWDLVAEEFGMTVKSAKERYRLLSIKLGWNDGPNNNNSTPSKATAKTPTPKKPTGVAKRSGKVGQKAQQTPKGKGKGKGKGKKSEDFAKDESDGTDELAKAKVEDSDGQA